MTTTPSTSASMVELINNSGVVFGAKESIRAALGSPNIDVDFDFESLFLLSSSSASSSSASGGASFLTTAEKRRVAEWILAVDTGYQASLRSAFFSLCKYPETASFFRREFGCGDESSSSSNAPPRLVHPNRILIKIVPVREQENQQQEQEQQSYNSFSHHPQPQQQLQYHHQPYDVGCFAERNVLRPSEKQTQIPTSAATSSVVLTLTFYLRVEREHLGHSSDMHRLEHAIASAYYPHFQTERLFGRIRHSARVAETELFLQRALTRDTSSSTKDNNNAEKSPLVQVIFPYKEMLLAMSSLDERIAAADWIAGFGFHGTMTGAFGLLTRFPTGRAVLSQRVQKISINLIPGNAGQDTDIVTDVQIITVGGGGGATSKSKDYNVTTATTTATANTTNSSNINQKDTNSSSKNNNNNINDFNIMYISFFLKSGGVDLRNSVDSHQLENSIISVLPELRAGHTRERILGSGELEKVRQAIAEATGQIADQVEVVMNVDTICSLEKDERKHATQWIIGEDATIHGAKRRRNNNNDNDNDNDTLNINSKKVPVASSTSPGISSSQVANESNQADSNGENDDSGDADTKDDDFFDSDATETSSVVSASPSAQLQLEQAVINFRHPSPMLNTIKVAFTALCKFQSGREILSKYRKFRINVLAALPTDNQPTDVVCAVESTDVMDGTMDLRFTLRTSRDLFSSSDSLQLARRISLALPELQRGKETEIVNKNGNWDELQDAIRSRLQNFHLLFDIDFWSITNIEPENVRKDIIAWLCGEGLESTLRKGFKALMNNTVALSVFDRFRRLEITCAVTDDDARLRDIVSCAATTANVDGVIGVVKSALVGAKAAPSLRGSLEPGNVGSSWKRLPALNLQFIFRVKDKNIRSDYDCSLKLEQAILGCIPALKRAHDKDVVDAASKIKKVQQDVNRALFISNAKYTATSNSALLLARRVESTRRKLLSTSSSSSSSSSPSALSSLLLERRRGSMYGLQKLPSSVDLRRAKSKEKTQKVINDMRILRQAKSEDKGGVASNSSGSEEAGRGDADDDVIHNVDGVADELYDVDDDDDETRKKLMKLLSTIKVEFDYDDVLSLREKDLNRALTWLTTESAFGATMRLAFEDLGHNEVFLSAFGLLVSSSAASASVVSRPASRSNSGLPVLGDADGEEVEMQKEKQQQSREELLLAQQKSKKSESSSASTSLRKIVIHVFARYLPREDSATVREEYLQFRKHGSIGVLTATTSANAANAASSSSTTTRPPSASTKQQPKDTASSLASSARTFAVVPGEVVFEASYQRVGGVLHLNCVLCKDDDSGTISLNCEARALEKVILACARDIDHSHH